MSNDNGDLKDKKKEPAATRLGQSTIKKPAPTKPAAPPPSKPAPPRPTPPPSRPAPPKSTPPAAPAAKKPVAPTIHKPAAPPAKPPQPPVSRPAARPPAPTPTRPQPGAPVKPRPAAAPSSQALQAKRATMMRVVTRQEARAARPLPPPPARRPVAAPPPPPAGPTVDQALLLETQQLQSQFTSLEGEAQLSSVYQAIGAIDGRLAELPQTLEAVRQRGYVHGGHLEDRLAALDDQWEDTRPRLEAALQDHTRRLDSDLNRTNLLVTRLSAATPATVAAARTAVAGLSRQVNAATSSLTGLYGGVESELGEVAGAISGVQVMLDTLEQSQTIQLVETEGLLAAVNAEWQRDGEDGPEGILFLTDQRLLFEQREEVVTKKFLGLFKSDSEVQQQLLLDVAAGQIETVESSEEGGFLGMGKADILELVLGPEAPVSRARFHLKGQESAEWATLIKRVKSGEIDEDRADRYVEEVEAAEAALSTFPTTCPNCFSPLPPPPRGVTSVTCEFCGSVINSS